MILEGADSPLSSIAVVQVGQYQLIVDALCGHVLLKCLGGFVIELLQFGAEPSCTQPGVASFVGSKDGFHFSIFEGDSKDDCCHKCKG